MFIEEMGQLYQVIAPVPLWFRYLVSYDEMDTSVGLTLGILLALVYLIMKVCTIITIRNEYVIRRHSSI